jgi:hypothetical protein
MLISDKAGNKEKSGKGNRTGSDAAERRKRGVKFYSLLP